MPPPLVRPDLAKEIERLISQMDKTKGPASVADAIGDYDERARVRNEFFAAERAVRLFLWDHLPEIRAALALAGAVDLTHRCRRWVTVGDPTYTGPSLSECNDAEDAALRTFRSAAGEIRP